MVNTFFPGLLKRLGWIQEYLLYFLMLSIAILIFVQVLLRYVFVAPLMGIEEILAFPTIWLYFLGGVNASRERSHIVAKILEVFMKKPITIYIENIFMSLFSTGIVLWLTYWAYDYFRYSLRSWKLSSSLSIPMFIGESAVFICLLFMSLYTILELIENISILVGYKRAKGEKSTCSA